MNIHDLWTEERDREANYQGWNIFAVDGNPTRLEIQKIDELEVFETDEDALNFVKSWAGESENTSINSFATSTCKLALEITGQ